MFPGGPDDDAGLIDGILQAGEQDAAPGAGSELLTFLFADIRGYTKFTQQRGDEAAAKLTGKFAMIVRDLVTEYTGSVFELRGDEAMCVFNSARQSLRFAVALQQRFVAETADDGNLPMTVGIGIDAGEAVRSEDGYRGGALNLAARLCSQAKAGDVLASPEVTHLARAIEGIRYVALDKVALKGLSVPVRPMRVLPEREDPAQQIAALVATAPKPADAPAVPWLPGRLAHLSPRALTSLAVVLVLVIAAVIVGVVQLTGGTNLKKFEENSAGIVDTGSGHLTAEVAVDAGPTAATSGYGSVWTANTGANTVSRIDPSSHHVIRTIDVGAAPSAITTGLQAVWVANSSSGTVSRIDPTTGQTQTITVGTAPGGLAVVGSSVWVTNTGDGTVSRIDPSQSKVVRTVEVGESPTGIAAGTDIWVANSGSNTVSQIDATSQRVVQTIHVGNDPRGIIVLGSSVWVTNNLDGTVARIATDGTSVADTVRVGADPTEIAAVRGHLWVATQAAQSVAEIDPRSARVLRTVHLGVIPGGVTAVGKQLWVTTTFNPTLHRGGTIHILGRQVAIDPVYAQSIWAQWLLAGTYDGLLGYRHATGAAGTTVVPDLATSIPEPTNGGRTYAFQVRSGVRWSTGQPLTPADVRRGIERTIATGFSPLAQEIVGASKCTVRSCDISGITVDPTADTVTITLVRPDVGFLERLATFAPAVPADTPLTEQKTKPIPGTGPYQVQRYVPGKLVVLTRNQYFHEWSAAAQPAGFPDSIEWQLDPTDSTKAGVDAVAAGQTDWADARGAGALGVLQSRFGDRLILSPTETTHGLVLNTRLAPFNDVRVRRALAFAIDRAAVADDWFTPGTVTCQADPPDFPGHRPYCPFTLRPSALGNWNAPDLGAALQLVHQSGTQGMPVAVWSTPPTAPGIRHVVSALQSLGYKATLKVISDPKVDYFGYTSDSRNKVQAAFYGWVADDVDPSNFFNPLFRCNAYMPANPLNGNPSGFCDHSFDRLMDRAAKVQASSPAQANDLWAEVDRRMVDAAPWIPLVNPTWADVVSTRVHNYQRSPVLGVFFDQMWVR